MVEVPDDDLTPTELIIDGEVDREDEEEMRRRKERSGEIVKELSDLVNYITPFHFKVPRSETWDPGGGMRETQRPDRCL